MRCRRVQPEDLGDGFVKIKLQWIISVGFFLRRQLCPVAPVVQQLTAQIEGCRHSGALLI